MISAVDHAGDIARRIAQLFADEPNGTRAVGFVTGGDRERFTVMVASGDGSMFRVTVEDTQWEMTEAESYPQEFDFQFEARERANAEAVQHAIDEHAAKPTLDQWIKG